MRMAVRRSSRGRGGARRDLPRVASVVTTFVLAGRYFEARAKRRAGAALRALLELGAKDVAVLDADGPSAACRSRELAVGDRFVVRPGEKVATDGVVEEGRSAVDKSHAHRRARAGRGRPRATRSPARPSTPAAGSSSARRGSAPTRRWRRSPGSSSEAQAGKAPVQRLADRVSGVFVPVVIVLAVATLGFWLGTGRGRVVRVHGGGRGADHRLPVRARAGHADRAAGRHRPRRAARDPDQGARGARVDPRASTRSCSTRPAPSRPGDGARPGRRRGGHRRRRGAAARRRARARVRAPGRPRDRRGGARRARRAARRSTASRTARASASRGSSTATPSSSDARRCCARLGRSTLPAELAEARARGRGARAARRSPPAGTAGRAPARRRRHGQADAAGGGRRAARARPAPGPAHRRQRADGPRPSPRRSASTT